MSETITTENAEQNVEETTTSTASGNAPAENAGAPADSAPEAAAAAEETRTFADFGVAEDIVASLAARGITTPFPIQAMTLPVALTGADIIGQAKTGTGKTLGFGLPLLMRTRIDERPHGGAIQSLVVVPTRELAVQVAQDLSVAAARRGTKIATIYGGRAFEPQIKQLQDGVDVVVGTPGRLLDLHRQRILDLSHVHTVILDEADEMLDLGFLPDVEKIIAAVPPVRQTMLFSATMPGAVITLARRYMTQPTHIRAAEPDDEGATVKNTTQFVYRAHAMDKAEVVGRILQAEGRGRTIVFTRTKRTAAKLADELVDRGFAAGALHGDLGQGAREQALRAFRSSKIDILVATDVAARGIDVDDVTHVINYQCPENEKTYLHRIGRTGRAGNRGTAVTFVDWDDVPQWKLISRALDLGFDEPVETYSTSPHLFSDLNIPAGTKGKLPRSKRTKPGLEAEEIEDLGETGRKNAPQEPQRAERRGRGDRGPRRRTRRDSGPADSGGSAETGPGVSRNQEHAETGDAPSRPRRRRRRGGSGRGTGGSGAQSD
ncbi:DEAD/DEAH box helicase [Sediminivirga luteola]|uniref:RNA helicase n=1 Tax=Sediminivirga luteola TaxID=1774748 RepID=A0A8J2XJK7_9MICO|nr:DEAD/DEAH box helicase [Sediminivirga luteola]GGA07419.1 DNA helicase [Sediminivirga luteola]